MKLSQKVMAGLALLLVNTQAHAMKAMVLEGGRVGNGGGLIVCRESPSGAVNSVELLDLYEAKKLRNMKLELNRFSGTWQEQVQAMIQRFAGVSPMRVELYGEWLKRLPNEIIFLKGVEFSRIPDTGHVAIPSDCEFEQGAIQTPPRFARDKRYFINDSLWQAMDETQRAALIFHELIYREAIGYGHDDSISVRYLTGFLLSDGIRVMTEMEFMALLEAAKFELTDLAFSDFQFTLPDSVELDLSQASGIGPGEDPIKITLKGRVPHQVGTCIGEGCAHFKPSAFVYHPIPDIVEMRLHPVTQSFVFGARTFKQKHDKWSGVKFAPVLELRGGKLNAVTFENSLIEGTQGRVPFLYRDSGASSGVVEATATKYRRALTRDTLAALLFIHPRMVRLDNQCRPLQVSYGPEGVTLAENRSLETVYGSECPDELEVAPSRYTTANGSSVEFITRPSHRGDLIFSLQERENQMQATGSLSGYRIGETTYSANRVNESTIHSVEELGTGVPNTISLWLIANTRLRSGELDLLLGDGSIQAWPNGIPREATLMEEVTLPSAKDDRAVRVKVGQTVSLDQRGRVISVK